MLIIVHKYDLKYYDLLSGLKHINQNSLVLDIGANIGDVSNFLYNKFMPTIYCYEPNISCHNYMLERFKNNPKIKLFNLAVSNFSGKSNLYFHINAKNINDPQYIQGATLRPEKDDIDLKKKIEIQCVDIKKILDDFKQIDLIKIDIEGAEYSIMPEIIKNKNKIKMIICETHGNPLGKKILSSDGTRMIMKNEVFKKEYLELINELKKLNLYGEWFHEWY
jgi:FkbM family methyltransferase